LPVADASTVHRVASCPLRASYAAVASAREFVRHVLADWGSEADEADLSRDLSDDVSLVASEMVANALQHGVGLDPPQDAVPAPEPPPAAEPDEQVGLTLLATPSVLLCVVNDPSSDAPVPRLPDPGTASGRGLHLIESLSESWGWSPVADDGVHAGEAVWATFPLAGDAPHGGAPGPSRGGPAPLRGGLTGVRRASPAWAAGPAPSVHRHDRDGGSWECIGVATPSSTGRSSTR
jgi:hypothetical protein